MAHQAEHRHVKKALPLHLRRLQGLFIVLLFYALGSALSAAVGHVVPGSVLGMLLLFFSLLAGVVRPDAVRPAAHMLTSSMSLFFIPAGVGVMAYWDVLDQNKLTIITAGLISTVLVIAATGWIQQIFEGKGKR